MRKEHVSFGVLEKGEGHGTLGALIGLDIVVLVVVINAITKFKKFLAA